MTKTEIIVSTISLLLAIFSTGLVIYVEWVKPNLRKNNQYKEFSGYILAIFEQYKDGYYIKNIDDHLMIMILKYDAIFTDFITISFLINFKIKMKNKDEVSEVYNALCELHIEFRKKIRRKLVNEQRSKITK